MNDNTSQAATADEFAATTSLRLFVSYFEDQVADWPRSTVERAYLSLVDRIDAGWRLVPPAPAPDEDTATADEDAVERAALRLMAGHPKNDEWFAERGAGTPADRWAECPEDDKRFWRQWARDVLTTAARRGATGGQA